jgi:cytochrome c oxidase subunit 2
MRSTNIKPGASAMRDRRELETMRMASFADRITGHVLAVASALTTAMPAGVAFAQEAAAPAPAPAPAPAGQAAAALGPGVAEPGVGQPAPWQIDLAGAATPIMERVHAFHSMLLPIITVIALFVLVLLIWVVYRYNQQSNPVSSRVTHHTLLEVAWTVVPIMILVVIAIPSFRLLYEQQTIPKADMTIKATGAQWYWSYEYPDNEGISFDANMLPEAEASPQKPRLLAVDNEVVVPINKVVRLQVTGADVIHAFAMPAFGIKVDAIPGRLNEAWFKATREGVFYGQCSELCGTKHAFMPIAIRVVSEGDFANWIATKKAETNGQGSGKVAAAATPAR